MAIEEKVADLLYTLAEIRNQTGNSKVRLMAEAMEVTVMEMGVLAHRDESQPAT